MIDKSQKELTDLNYFETCEFPNLLSLNLSFNSIINIPKTFLNSPKLQKIQL